MKRIRFDVNEFNLEELQVLAQAVRRLMANYPYLSDSAKDDCNLKSKILTKINRLIEVFPKATTVGQKTLRTKGHDSLSSKQEKGD